MAFILFASILATTYGISRWALEEFMKRDYKRRQALKLAALYPDTKPPKN